jgi:phasin
MGSYLNHPAPATMNLFLETVQPKQTISPFWRLVEERPIVPSRASLEIPGEMRAFAERSVEQAKSAFDKFMDATQSTVSTFEAQSKVSQAATMKSMNFAEQNVASAFDYAQKLIRAKDPQTLLALHGEFMSSQMQVLCMQARTLGEMTSKVAIE